MERTKWAETATTHASKPTVKEPIEHLFWGDLCIEALATTSWEATTTESTKWRTTAAGGAWSGVESAIRVSSKLVITGLLIGVGKYLESSRNHYQRRPLAASLEAERIMCLLTFKGLVCAIICVLIWVCQQTEFAIRLLDLAVRSSLLNRKDLIKIGCSTFSDS
jgi:hypothetical protein